MHNYIDCDSRFAIELRGIRGGSLNRVELLLRRAVDAMAPLVSRVGYDSVDSYRFAICNCRRAARNKLFGNCAISWICSPYRFVSDVPVFFSCFGNRGDCDGTVSIAFTVAKVADKSISK